MLAENIWLHLNLIKEIVGRCNELFASGAYGYTHVPSYPSGSLGFVVFSKDDARANVTTPRRSITEAEQEQMRYYSPEVHSASFALPHFARKALDEATKAAAETKRTRKD